MVDAAGTPRADSSVATIGACLRLLWAAGRFLLGSPGISELETVTPDPRRLRLAMILRMTVFRRRDGFKWPYRHRRARALRAIRRVVPDAVWYRLLVLPMCIAELARLTRRNVARFGADWRRRTGRTGRQQFADVLALCLTHPGTFPSEYYVFGLNRGRFADEAADYANGYEVETAIALRQPASHLHQASGFPSETLDLVNNKERFRELCVSLGLPVSRSCAIFTGGEVQWTEAGGFPARDLFIKPLYGGGGYGAARAFYAPDTRTYRLEQPLVAVTAPYPSEPMSAGALAEWLREVGRTIPFGVEPRIVAHPDLVALVGDTTLPTLRVVTMMDAAGREDALFIYLRSATKDSPVDNVSAGGIATLVDLETGELGASIVSFGEAAETHPRTGRVLRGARVPFVRDVIDACRTAHRAVASGQPLPAPVLGWDVAVAETGPIFLEGNTLSDLSTAQKLIGRGCWTLPLFRHTVLSHMAVLDGRRIPIDPGATAGA